jgi:hypothetical protein
MGYEVTLIKNIIVNNVAGWDGGGVSLQDALRVRLINNTIVANDATATAGVLFNTLGAYRGSAPPPGCNPGTGVGCNNPVTSSTPQAAGLVTTRNTPNLTASLPGIVICPLGHTNGLNPINGDCREISYPLLFNNIFWQNRAFNITVGGLGPPPLNQQTILTLVPTLNQTSMGQCVSGANYWDIGVRGDTGPANHSSGFTLSPAYSILTDAGQYPGANNMGANPAVLSQYCNGSRVPPENGGMGYNVPPGVSEAIVPIPPFSLTPGATVDEGNNWVNITYGPLSTVDLAGAALGDYRISGVSPALDAIPLLSLGGLAAPDHDFFNNPRKQIGNPVDIGAVEGAAVAPPPPPPPPPPMPDFGAPLDTFNRANANTLGGNWQQLVFLGQAGIRVNASQAFCTNSGPAAILCAAGANAYWNSGGAAAIFGATQGAEFQFANATVNNAGLYLKGGGGFNGLGTYNNSIRVRYSTGSGGQVIVETTNNGVLFTTRGTLAASFVSGDTLTARVDASGIVYVWKTAGAVTTYLGQVALPTTGSNSFTTGTGRIGLFLPSGGRVDNFDGGTITP